MGLFGGIKDTYRKSEAAVVVQNLLETQVNSGLFEMDPARFANKLVQVTWDSKPEIFNGKLGQRPDKVTTAAMSLLTGITLMGKDDLNRNALMLCLGNLLAEIERNASLYSFNKIDEKLLSNAAHAFSEISEEFVA